MSVVMYFQRRCRLKFFLAYGLMLTKTEKNRKKNQKCKIWKTNKNVIKCCTMGIFWWNCGDLVYAVLEGSFLHVALGDNVLLTW